MTYPHADQSQVDPFDQALQDEPSIFAGKIDTHAWTCVLIKGQGKVAFNPDAHKGLRTSTAIDIYTRVGV